MPIREHHVKTLSSGLIGLLLLTEPLAHAFEPTTPKVTDNMYAIIGELDQRSADNQGLNEGMLGVLPEITKIKDWQATFKKMTELKPEHMIAGHGAPSDLATAQKNTGDYLDWLVAEVGKSLAEMEDLGDAVKRLSADDKFSFLKLSKDLLGRNVHQTYLQLEAK